LFFFFALIEELQSQKILTRRRKLPAICPDGSQVSVWGIMRKAIGKDLSKISLPVILNEPLGILQVEINFKVRPSLRKLIKLKNFHI